MREVVVLGSTGSIGTQALDVVRRQRGAFRVVGLAASGSRLDLLAAQAREFDVEAVAVADTDAAAELPAALAAAAEGPLPKILAGPDAATEVATWPADVVLNGMSGSIGLAPTLAALGGGATLALANKESLVAGGPLVLAAAAAGQLVPVDSEHSALAQCLRGGRREELRRLVLTASGGPFVGRSRAELARVTPADALVHPTWQMGPVVTVNSATLVNKGLEVIEAHLLFGVPYDDITVAIHPQSVIHSMVEFVDGSVLAQCSPPDMRLPISLALGWPDRVPDAAPALDWSAAHTWELRPLDDTVFPAVQLAREVGRTGGTAPAVYNAANEEAVAAFLAGRLPFPAIVDTVAAVVGAADRRELTSVDDVLDAERWARAYARTHLQEASE